MLISRRKNTAQGRLDYAAKKQKYFEKNIETFPNSLRVIQRPTWTPEALEKNQQDVIAKLSEYLGVPDFLR